MGYSAMDPTMTVGDMYELGLLSGALTLVGRASQDHQQNDEIIRGHHLEESR
jgi:hypothetical protein